MVSTGDPNQKVKVILQSDDIKNPELLNILRRNNVVIESRAENLNMLVVELPVAAAEQIAAFRGAKHLSLDKEMSLLGHIEATTGVDAMRAVSGNSALNGKNVGIAILDSAIFDGHHTFLDSTGNKRIVEKKEFVTGGSEDKFGHGTHVAAIAAGRGGKPGDASFNSCFEKLSGRCAGSQDHRRSCSGQ